MDQKEYMPVWGNWQGVIPLIPGPGEPGYTPYDASEPFSAQPGEFPAFSIVDCVSPANGYTLSSGWVRVGATIRMSQSTRVKEIGVNFTGGTWVDANGDYTLIGSNEWGRVRVWSVFDVRSLTPGGSYTWLTPLNSQMLEEEEYNDSGLTMGYLFDLSNRHVSQDLQVNSSHEFIVDYTLKWEVSQSNEYWSSACFEMDKLAIKPYIIYESCHSEWKEVSRFYKALSQMMVEESRHHASAAAPLG